MHARISKITKAGVFLAFLCVMVRPVAAQNSQILGEVRFQPENGPAKTAGVWVDGKYVGYLSELKGSKKLLLLPGEHQISVREAGYRSVDQKIDVQPNAVQTLKVSLAKDPRAQYPTVSAEVRLSIDPDRAAVFVDDQYAGHAHEFGGAGRAMLLSPGKHRIKITLPGYQSFQTEIEVRANQKYDIKTQLPKGRESAEAPSS
ncbi:MAG: Serine/threonine protein kinase [Candidatus Acidoferrum typicum]|nr:Serine/threonine protein kinase [Candidatus Acidoferrum typicum]